jgi:hypothetical protein
MAGYEMRKILHSDHPASSLDFCFSISKIALTSSSANERHSVSLSDRSVRSCQLFDSDLRNIQIIGWRRDDRSGPRHDRLASSPISPTRTSAKSPGASVRYTDYNPLPLGCSGEYRPGSSGRIRSICSLGRIRFSTLTNDTRTRHPTSSQHCPRRTWKALGFPQQYDCAIPIAAMRVSTNENTMSPGATSRMNS